MRMYPREFPANRRRKPKRHAERRICEALAVAASQGFVYYEWRRGYEHIELDLAVWIVVLGRFALQVGGGHYLLIDGEWYLKTRNGLVPIETSPLDEAWLAALELHDKIEERAATPYNPYIIPVLVFGDLVPDPVIEGLARRKGVYLVWRTDDLVADLSVIVRGREVSGALSTDRICREVCAVTDGLIRLGEVQEEEEAPARIARPVAKSPAPYGLELIHLRAREVRFQRGIIIGPETNPFAEGPAATGCPGRDPRPARFPCLGCRRNQQHQISKEVIVKRKVVKNDNNNPLSPAEMKACQQFEATSQAGQVLFHPRWPPASPPRTASPSLTRSGASA